MSVITAVETQINDPLQYVTPLPYAARLYPRGFPADIASNAPEVLAAARESWGVYQPQFDRPPIRVHCLVSDGGAERPPDPVLRGQRHLLLWVSDQENFAVCDWRRRFASSFVTRATVADPVFFRWHFLDALVYMLQELNNYISVHAACIAWKGDGVLLYGDSGMGKSTLSYACARQGWTYIADDASSILWDDARTVLGEPHHFRFRQDAPEIFPELRGLTVGRQLDRKPTIEVMTANLPIRTAAECRVSRIVFVNRAEGSPPSLQPLPAEESRRRLLRDMVSFDPDLEQRRLQVIESIAELPAFELTYSNYPEALAQLQNLVRS
jgi:hypothetical protein